MVAFFYHGGTGITVPIAIGITGRSPYPEASGLRVLCSPWLISYPYNRLTGEAQRHNYAVHRLLLLTNPNLLQGCR